MKKHDSTFFQFLSLLKSYCSSRWKDLRFFYAMLSSADFSWRLLRIDLIFFLSYLFWNPYRIARKENERRDAGQLYDYGETPFPVAQDICSHLNLTEKDCFLDLGCGRGKLLYYLNALSGCKAKGAEKIEYFVDKGNAIASQLGLAEKVRLKKEHILRSDFEGVTAIFLFGTALPIDLLNEMLERFSLLPKGVRVITVSFPLEDLCKKKSPFEIIASFEAEFNWGSTMIYVQESKS